MHRLIGTFILSMLLLGLSGCSYLFYPRAGDYATQAKGASGVETMINLTNMMEVSANKAKGGKGLDTALDDYHNQLHALLDSYGNVTKEQAKTPAYDLAITHADISCGLGVDFYSPGCSSIMAQSIFIRRTCQIEG